MQLKQTWFDANTSLELFFHNIFSHYRKVNNVRDVKHILHVKSSNSYIRTNAY